MTEPTSGKGLTFEKVWVMFQEIGRQIKENDRLMREYMEESDRRLKEIDRRLKESMAETERQMKEIDKLMKERMEASRAEVDRELKEASRIVGDSGDRFGRLAGHLVVPTMMEKFNALGYEFTRTIEGTKIQGLDPDKESLTEIGILLENRDLAIVVEVRFNLTSGDVRQRVERMEKLRRYWDAHNDKRKLIGAVAEAVMEDSVKAIVLETGFYAIVQSGDTLKIEAPEGFTPRVW